MNTASLLFVVLCSLVGPALAQTTKLKLPKGLQEISGLAAATDHSVYAHNDEHAIIYEINLKDGDIEAAFALGDPTARGDFEGVAFYGGRIYLITSNGYLYEAKVVSHGERTRFNVFDTGVGAFCEAEGLALSPDESGAFLILCKENFPEDKKDRLVIYRWSLSERLPVAAPFIEMETHAFLTDDQRRGFAPSAIETTSDGRMFILSARNNLLVEMDKSGDASVRPLAASVHRQAEGVTFLPDGAMVIADEGARRGAGSLTIYRAE